MHVRSLLYARCTYAAVQGATHSQSAVHVARDVLGLCAMHTRYKVQCFRRKLLMARMVLGLGAMRMTVQAKVLRLRGAWYSLRVWCLLVRDAQYGSVGRATLSKV